MSAMYNMPTASPAFRCIVPVLAAACFLVSASAAASSLKFVENEPEEHEYGHQVTLPAGFGEGEFTFEIWVKLDDSYPVGPIPHDEPDRLVLWASQDPQPYSSSEWWYRGNFLLDGHNNNNSNFHQGTFSIQFYGGGRVRWSFGDGQYVNQGAHWSVQAWPATQTDTLLDGQWHHIACVRRWLSAGGARLLLWVDGVKIATQDTPLRTNMATTYWNNWTGFPNGQEGWFYGSEKQAAIGILPMYEDYKGLIDEMRFWSRAKTNQELMNDWADAVTGNEPGLVGWYTFSNSGGTSTCNALTSSQCMQLFLTNNSNWVAEDAPVGGAADPNYVYVDFSSGASGSGTQASPFNTLSAAVNAANSGATIEIAPSATSETASITKPLTLINGNPGGGPVQIGTSGAFAPALGRADKGFVSSP